MVARKGSALGEPRWQLVLAVIGAVLIILLWAALLLFEFAPWAQGPRGLAEWLMAIAFFGMNAVLVLFILFSVVRFIRRRLGFLK